MTNSTIVTISFDISNYISDIEERFQQYLESTPDFEMALETIRNGDPVKTPGLCGNLDLHHPDGGWYKWQTYEKLRSMFFYLNTPPLKALTDEVIRHNMARNNKFKRFIIAIIDGTKVCDNHRDLKIKKSPYLLKHFGDDSPVCYQAETLKVFLE